MGSEAGSDLRLTVFKIPGLRQYFGMKEALHILLVISFTLGIPLVQTLYLLG